MALGRSSGPLRRYLIAKKKTKKKMSAVIPIPTNSRNAYSASTSPAPAEARGGNMEKLPISRRLEVPAEHDRHESCQRRYGRKPRDTKYVHNHHSVSPIGGIIMIAIKHHCVHRRSYAAIGRLH